MAEAGHYEEKTDAYRLVENANAISCVRVFHDGNSAATGSLPSVGDPLDATSAIYKTVRVRQRTKTKYGGHPSVNLWLIEYDNNPQQGQGAGNDVYQNSPSMLPTSVSIAGEFVTMDGTKSGSVWSWKNALGAVNQQIPVRTNSGAFKITKRLASLPLGFIAKYIGKINSATMQVAGSSFAATLVLFEGINSEEYYNNKGDKRYKVDFNFAIKATPSGSDYVGWDYILNETTGLFDRPQRSGTTGIYASANLNDLFNLRESA